MAKKEGRRNRAGQGEGCGRANARQRRQRSLAWLLPTAAHELLPGILMIATDPLRRQSGAASEELRKSLSCRGARMPGLRKLRLQSTLLWTCSLCPKLPRTGAADQSVRTGAYGV